MAGIVFYFENNDRDVWSGRRIDLDAWNYNCKIGNIDKAIIVNLTSQELITFDGNMDVTFVNELPSLIGHVTQLVTPIETTGTTPLWDFNHETDWYILGPSSGWGGNYFADTLLTIPQQSPVYHHSVFVATTLMFHRHKTLFTT